MRNVLAVLLLAAAIGGTSKYQNKPHPDYVPDETTAERIAEAVLVAQFGQHRVRAQMPLHARSTRNLWLVEGSLRDKEGRPQVGGAFGVSINKHSGCLSVMERMK
jgi:hypothetical protein